MKKIHSVFLVALLGTILVGILDYRTGAQVSMMLFYSLPILVAARYCGKSEGIAVAVTAASCWLLSNLLARLSVSSELILSWNAMTRLGIFMLLAYTVSLQSNLKKSLEREKQRASTDRLTGLLNKTAFREHFEEEMAKAQRYNHPLSLAFIDLDNFKEVNDTRGHATGDRLLQQVSETIVNSIRKTDIAGRIGGDEFTICFPETDDTQVRSAIQKLVKELDIMTSQSGWQVTASIGVVTCKETCVPYDAILGKADKLMYVAKEKGKNAAEFDTV